MCLADFSSIYPFGWWTGLTSSGLLVFISWRLSCWRLARSISQVAQFLMNLPPVQNNVVSSAVTVALGVTCLVFNIIEMALDIAFPPVRHNVRHPRRQKPMQPASNRVDSMSSNFPLTTTPTLASPEMRNGGIELEDMSLDESPEEMVWLCMDIGFWSRES